MCIQVFTIIHNMINSFKNFKMQKYFLVFPIEIYSIFWYNIIHNYLSNAKIIQINERGSFCK